MKLEGHIYCEGPDCEDHQHLGSDRTEGMTLRSLPPGWLVVTEYGTGEPTLTAFCNGDCLLKWAASWSEPPITFGGEGE